MSITILQTPGDTNAGASAHYPLWVMAGSTQSSTAGMRYVFDIYRNGYLIHRARVAPLPNTGQGVFDVAPIVRSYLQDHYFYPDTTELVAMNYNWHYLDYSVQVGEQIGSGGTPSGFVTVSNQRAYNAYRNILPGSALKPVANFYKRPVSERPPSLDYPMIGVAGDCLFYSFHNNGGAPLRFFLAAIINGGTTNLGGIDIDVTTAYPEPMVVLNLSSTVLSAAYPTTFDACLADPGLDYFRFGLTSYFNLPSQIRHPNVAFKYACNAQAPCTLHFLNRLGGHDTFSFLGVNRLQADVDRKSYQRRQSEAFGNTMRDYDSTTQVYKPATIPYATTIKTGYKLQSHYLREGEYRWLLQLLASPEVWMENDGFFYPVTIVTDKWSEKYNRADKMFQLELEIKSDQPLNAQYR